MISQDRNSKHIPIGKLKEHCDKIHKQGKTICFTYGTFDVLHSGHAVYLMNAKSQADVLIVGVATNSSKQVLRGKNSPLIDQTNRAELLQHFDFVDYTIFCDPRDLLSVLKKIRPDVFNTLAIDWRSHLRKPEEEKYMKKIDARVIKNPVTSPYISASEITKRVADLKIKQMVEYFFGKAKINLAEGDWKKKKWSGLKTDVRTETLHFGNHADDLSLFNRQYFGDMIKRNEIKKLGKKLRKEGKKIVLSSGACDIIHAAHARFYQKARENADVLVLALPSNRIIQKQKGRGRPIVDEYSRAELMGFFNFIDHTVIFDDKSVLEVIKDLKPNVFFTVEEGWNKIDKENGVVKAMKKFGGKVVTVPPQASGLSSTKLIRKAAGLRVKKVFKEVLDEAEKYNPLKD